MGRIGVCMKILSFFMAMFLWSSALFAQIPLHYQLDVAPDRSGLVGNGITDLRVHHDSLFVGTGYGLSLTEDAGFHWTNYTPREYKRKGGISALTIAPDGTVWIATGYDTTVENNQTLAVGGGLRYLTPGTSEWVYIPQPKDAVSDTMGGMSPTTTAVQNITFDIAVRDTEIWIASFGGGIRRSRDMGQTWEVVTTDGKPFSALKYLNHRGFSVMTENGNIWVGTADGISKSTDGGQTWTRYRVVNYQPKEGGISGNWVIALAYNPWDGSVWACTLTTGGNEFNSVSRTLDGGYTWDNLLVEELSDGTYPRAIAFYDSAVYVATEKGVFKSIDGGESWYLFPQITDNVSGEKILTTKFYSVATAPFLNGQHRLWVGSADGLALTTNNGYQWTIFRSFVSTRKRTKPAVYAYPNPFSPRRGDYIRFQFDISSETEVKIDIFNFAMEKVISLREFEAAPVQGTYDRSAIWDGRDNNGRMVDNGVYFFRAEIQGKVTWGKIVVIN